MVPAIPGTGSSLVLVHGCAATREGRRYWTEFARKAETDLAAATRPTALSAAAKKLMRARPELKQLQVEASA